MSTTSLNRAEIVVVGGTGFLGRRLVQLLREEGRTVAVMSRRAGADIQGSVADATSVAAAVKGASVVYHLATGSGDRWGDFERDFLNGARNVADACRRNHIRRLVYTSSIAALYAGGQTPIDERTSVDHRIGERSFYARAKAGAEQILVDSGLPVVVVRPGIIVGRGGLLNHTGVGYWPSDVCCLGWGRGDHALPFVLVQDVARALVAAAHAPGVDGVTLNLVGDVRPSAQQFVSWMAARSHRNVRFYPQSLWKMQALEIFKWTAKVAGRRTGLTFPPYRDLKSRSLRAPFECSRAKQLLGWRPNADIEVFVQEAIDSCIRPIAPGDLRLAAELA